MNKQDITRLAREAGFSEPWAADQYFHPYLERFASLVTQVEREACAKVCEDYDTRNNGVSNIGGYLGKQIRKREQV